jgi:hypothetical protein
VARQIHIPEKLMALHPGYTKQELRAIIRVVLNHKTSKLKSSHIVNFTMSLISAGSKATVIKK